MIYLFAALAVSGSAAFGQTSDTPPVLDVIFYEDPIASFTKKDGSIAGASVDLMRPLLDKTGVNYRFRILPWVRLYRQALTSDRMAVMHLLRTKDREDQFHWLYKISVQEHILISRNTAKMKALSAAEIVNGPYMAVCEEHAAQCAMLRQFGFSESKIMRLYDMTPGEHANLIATGRFDFMIDNIPSLSSELKVLGIAEERLFEHTKVSESAEYLAASKTLDPRLVEQLKTLQHR